MTILMTPPTRFEVTYQINPWMKSLGSVAKQSASDQWKQLHDAISPHATVIETVPNEHPDFVFTANAGLVYGREVILSSFFHTQRQAEEPFWRQLFERQGYTIHTLCNTTFEGAGDALFAGELLIGGYGFRTQQEAYKQVQTIWGIEVLCVELVDERFYHLDTCLCVLDEDTIMYYPPAFSIESQIALEKQFNSIVVHEPDALQFACNAVVLGEHIVLPTNTAHTQQALKKNGYAVHAVPMGEFLKSGGAAKCLTLAL